MKATKTKLSNVIIIEPDVFGDERGYFYESYNKSKFDDILGDNIDFVQDNFSLSSKGVLRGLHYQLAPFSQAKLLSCLEGEIFDVVVDIRKQSPTFKQWIGVFLNAKNKKSIWIPKGFAHGFLTMSETARVSYKVTDFYNPAAERSIIWNDPQINIDWPDINNKIISRKDKLGLPLECSELYDE